MSRVLVIAAALVLCACFGTSEAGTLLISIDRNFEDTHVRLRTAGDRLLFFVLESNVITRWFEASLTMPEQRLVWEWTDALEEERLESVYREPPKSPADPIIIHELDEITLRWVRDDSEHSVHLHHRSFGPPAVASYTEKLESLAVRIGHIPEVVEQLRASTAWLAEPWAKPSLVAQDRPRGDRVSKNASNCSTLDDALLGNDKALRASLDKPGWLQPATSTGADERVPNIVCWKGESLRVRRLRIALVG